MTEVYVTDTWTMITLMEDNYIKRGEILIWLRNNMGEKAEWVDIALGDDTGKNWAYDGRNFYWFRNERDATMFILRWK